MAAKLAVIHGGHLHERMPHWGILECLAHDTTLPWAFFSRASAHFVNRLELEVIESRCFRWPHECGGGNFMRNFD